MKLRIVGKNDCPWCVLAKELAEKHGVEYVYQTLYEDISVQDLLEEVPNASTVPVIFVDSEHIGGYQALERMLERNNNG